MEEKFIPYGRQWIDEDDIQAVINVLRSDFLTTGPKVEEFEKKFCAYVGAEYGVSISNGTAALHAACFAADIGEGDEVITSPITFAASANAILYCKGKPVFADIDPKTYNISPEDIRRKITSKTRAIIPVHFTGQPCDMDEIHKIAREYDLKVIEDGAHALGAEYRGKKIGSISDMTTFSFHPVKHITTAEGGMITTNDEALYQKLLLFRSHGITRNTDLFENKSEGPWYYEQLSLGYNYRMTDIQCALGISQLNKLNDFVSRRIEIVEKYNKAFENLHGVMTPYEGKSCKSSWHLYVIKLELKKLKAGRREIFEALRAENIGVNVHYIPVYYLPYYEALGYKKGICKEAEKLYEAVVTLPLYSSMEDKDVDKVIEKVTKVIKQNAL